MKDSILFVLSDHWEQFRYVLDVCYREVFLWTYRDNPFLPNLFGKSFWSKKHCFLQCERQHPEQVTCFTSAYLPTARILHGLSVESRECGICYDTIRPPAHSAHCIHCNAEYCMSCYGRIKKEDPEQTICAYCRQCMHGDARIVFERLNTLTTIQHDGTIHIGFLLECSLP